MDRLNPPAAIFRVKPKAGSRLPRERIALVSGPLFLGVVGLLVWVALGGIERQLRQDAAGTLQTVLGATNESYRIWAENMMHYSKELSTTPELLQLAHDQLSVQRKPEDLLANSALGRLRAFFQARPDKHGEVGFFVISRDHINVASMRDENVGTVNLIAQQREDLLERVFEGNIELIPPIFSDVPLPDSSGGLVPGRPTMFVAAPLRDEAGGVIAVLTIRFDPGGDFTHLAQAGRLGQTGETYLFDRTGVLLTESRFREQLAETGLVEPGESEILSIRISDPGGNLLRGFRPTVGEADQPLTVAAAGAIGRARGYDVDGYRDYRGVPVFGAWLWDDMLGIGMATEIDADEALRSYYAIRMAMLLVLGSAVLIYAVLTFPSIRLHQQAERRLRDNEERMRLTIDTALDAIVTADSGGRITGWNPQAEAIFGRSREEAVGCEMAETIVPARYRQAHRDGLRRFLETGETTALGKRRELGALHRDGHEFQAELSITPIVVGGQQFFTAFMRDITERKRAEEAVRKSEADYRALVEHATYGIYRSSAGGKFLTVNTALVEMLGYETKEELLAVRMDRDVYRDPEAHAAQIESETFAERIDGVEAEWQRKDGGPLTVRLSGRPVYDQEGEIECFEMIAEDVTEQRKLEARYCQLELESRRLG